MGPLTCFVCKKEFISTWNDEDAIEELKENFSGYEKENCKVVCDDCYEEIRRSLS